MYDTLSSHMKNSFKNYLYDQNELVPIDEPAAFEYGGTGCTLNTFSCPKNEVCRMNNMKSRAGTCRCKEGYVRNTIGECELALSYKDEAVNGILNDRTLNLSNTSDTKRQLKVVAENKEIKLPNNEVSLTASVSPPPAEDEVYQYEWTSLNQPEGSSAVKQKHGEELKLSKLNEGMYTFKVIFLHILENFYQEQEELENGILTFLVKQTNKY